MWLMVRQVEMLGSFYRELLRDTIVPLNKWAETKLVQFIIYPLRIIVGCESGLKRTIRIANIDKVARYN